MRDFLYSEIANFHGIPNMPEDPVLAIKAGERLCQDLLDPLFETFGQITIRSSYRSPTVNGFGNQNGLNCARNEENYAGHIWDERDREGRFGAAASSRSAGSRTSSTPAATGATWPGGSTTISRTGDCAFTRGKPPSI